MVEMYGVNGQSVTDEIAAEATTLRLVGDGLPKGSWVLDLGAGSNEQVASLQENGYRAIGVDCDLGLMRRPGVRAKDCLVIADVARLPFETGSVQAVTACALLARLEKGKTEAMAGEIDRTTRGNPEALSYFTDLWTREDERSKKNGEILTRRLAEAGFKPVTKKFGETLWGRK